MESDYEVLKTYALGDLIFSSSWTGNDKSQNWMDAYFGGVASSTLVIQVWHGRPSGASAPYKKNEFFEMPIYLPLSRNGMAVARWRVGPGVDDVQIANYALKSDLELLEIRYSDEQDEAEKNESVPERRYGFVPLWDSEDSEQT